jgi:hypothetical protein
MRILPVVGFPDYQISDTGVIYSRKIRGSKTGRTGDWWPLKLRFRNGYAFVTLYRTVGVQEHFDVHVLLMTTFIGPCPEGQLVRHLNDIRSDNRLENLAYGTQADNVNDMFRNNHAQIGENHYAARFTNNEVNEIRRRRKAGERSCDIARQLNVPASTIYNIVNGYSFRNLDDA